MQIDFTTLSLCLNYLPKSKALAMRLKVVRALNKSHQNWISIGRLIWLTMSDLFHCEEFDTMFIIDGNIANF